MIFRLGLLSNNGNNMDKVIVYFQRDSDTMDIRLDDPEMKFCEEAGEGIILKKDKCAKVTGIEKLYVSKPFGISRPFPVE